jgi:hypothetical protein
MTEPARKAQLKALVHALSPAAITVVRALENTATFIPMSPDSMDVSPPAMNATAVRPPSSMWNLPPVSVFLGGGVKKRERERVSRRVVFTQIEYVG